MWVITPLIGYLFVLSVYDIRFHKIPLPSLIGGGLLSGIYMLLTYKEEISSLSDVLNFVNGWMPGIFMLIAGWVTNCVGEGDGWVLLIVGSILGAGKMTWVFSGSLLLSAIAAGTLWSFHKVKRKDQLPYIPFLTVTVMVIEIWERGGGY